MVAFSEAPLANKWSSLVLPYFNYISLGVQDLLLDYRTNCTRAFTVVRTLLARRN